MSGQERQLKSALQIFSLRFSLGVLRFSLRTNQWPMIYLCGEYLLNTAEFEWSVSLKYWMIVLIDESLLSGNLNNSDAADLIKKHINLLFKDFVRILF